MPPVHAVKLSVVITIGGVAIQINSEDEDFLELLRNRYIGFVGRRHYPEIVFDVELTPPVPVEQEVELSVKYRLGRWVLDRGDFWAEFDPQTLRGMIRQSANPYSMDALLRIVHSIMLARQGGFLLHSASAIRNGKAFLFAGISGAGKTTISRLAPQDAILLTDEISYVRKMNDGYGAFGTPFAGELARLGENCSAPLEALYLLAQGPENCVEPVSPAEAGRQLMANMLFFADDSDLVQCAFQSACDFVDRVPVFRLTFAPTKRIWEMIG